MDNWCNYLISYILFIDKEFNLTLKLFDKKGNEYKLVHKKSVFWEPDLWVQIICSWNKDHAKIRTLNPSNEMDFNESTIKLDNIDLFYMPINPPMIIGTDLTNKYFAKMIISNLNLYDNPII